MHENATHDSSITFTDPGATCIDDLLHCAHLEDCVLPVTVSGDEVDLNVIGTYWIHYHCTSPAGYTLTLPREVIVEDIVCPTCAFAADDSDNITIEASFPYDATDHRPSCTDDCGYSSDLNCVETPTVATIISNNVDVEKTGTWQVVYNAVDYHGNTCHGSRIIRTVNVVDTMKPIIGLQFNANTSAVRVSSHTGGSSSVSYNPPTTNPAKDHFQDYSSLMAITGSSSISWLLSATAAVVACVAMFAGSKNKNAFVPV